MIAIGFINSENKAYFFTFYALTEKKIAYQLVMAIAREVLKEEY